MTRTNHKAVKRHDYDHVEATSADELLPHDEQWGGKPSQGTMDSVLSATDITVCAAEISIDDAIDSLGTGKFQRILLFAAGLCFAADSSEITLLGFLSEILEVEWDLTGRQTATIASCVFAGSLAGTLILGPLGDRIGRRPVFIACALIISVFGMATAASTSFFSLVLTRFMVGFGVGGLTVPFDILAEFLPTYSRGKYLLLIEYFWTAGSISVPVIAFFTIGKGASWQLFVMLCAIPCLCSAVIAMYCVPGSPRWLVSQGRTTEAKYVLRKAAVMNGVDPDDVLPEEAGLQAEEEESSQFLDLFKPKWRKLTLFLWGTWWGYAFGYYGTILAVTRVFETEDDEDENDANDKEMVQFDYSAIFISSTAEVVGTAVAILIIDRIGRIPTQVFSCCVGGVFLFLLCFFSTTGSRAFLVSVSFFARVCEMMGSCTTWITTAEALSTEIRTTGHSAANAVGRLGDFICPFVVAGDITLPVVGIVMLVVHGLTALSVSFLPETKGRALGNTQERSAALSMEQISHTTELGSAFGRRQVGSLQPGEMT